MPAKASLTKSRYMAGNQCARRLWQQCHDRLTEEEADSSAAMIAGQEIGVLAHQLFPGGILVEAEPTQLRRAAEETRALMARKDVPAIFEATLIAGRHLVRIDVLERLPRQRWGIREVKSSTSVKDEHYEDAAFQLYVASEAGLTIGSVEMIHIDKTYALAAKGLELDKYFARVDITAAARQAQENIAKQARAHLRIIDRAAAPRIEPWHHCFSPYECEFLHRCTASHPDDWILNLPRLGEKTADELRRRGILSIADIPDDIALSHTQTIVQQAHKSGRPFVSPQLKAALMHTNPPAYYLDFEAMLPAVPVYEGTRPYQAIPFQWSLHHVGQKGKITHQEFLADGRQDPREEFTKTLLAALQGSDEPILVYSGYERTTLTALAQHLPKYRKQIGKVIDRLSDLLKVVKQHYYHSAFNGSYSIKAVGPTLAQSVDYDALDDVADGAAAASAFEALATGRATGSEAKRLRKALLRYCHLDTLAMIEVHRALRSLRGPRG